MLGGPADSSGRGLSLAEVKVGNAHGRLRTLTGDKNTGLSE